MRALKLTDAVLFLSTLSLRRATGYAKYYIHAPEISIHALLAESDNLVNSIRLIKHVISIHALLAESDDVIAVITAAQSISIHALLAESDYFFAGGMENLSHFYPRSPCGERQSTSRIPRSYPLISIHALLAESD